MIKVENTEIVGWEHAIRGMRNPMNSWDKCDTQFLIDIYKDPRGYDSYVEEPNIGKADHKLMMQLAKAGTDHRKYLRMITVYCDITAPQFWWFEFDTYKVGTVRNSCSKMHKIHVKEFTLNDFTHEGCEEAGEEVIEWLREFIRMCNYLRDKFNSTQEKKYWRALIELLPEGFNVRATVSFNYEVLANMYHSRKNHRLDEWLDFCKWIESLPYSELITGKEK